MREALCCARVATAVALLGLLGSGGCVAPQGMARPSVAPVPPEKLEYFLSEARGVVSVAAPFTRTTLDPAGRSIDFHIRELPSCGVLVGERTLLLTRHQLDESEGHILVEGQYLQYRVERAMPKPTCAAGWALLTDSSAPIGWAKLALSSAPKRLASIDVDGQTALPDGATIFIVHSELVNPEDAQRAYEESRFDTLRFRRKVAVGRVVQRKPKWLRAWMKANPEQGHVLSEWLLVLGMPRLTRGMSGAAAFWWPDGSEDPICVGVAEAGVEFRDRSTGELLDSGGLICRPREPFSDSTGQVAPNSDHDGVQP